MQVSRCIEGSVKVGIEDLVFDSQGIEEAIEQQRVRVKNRSSIDPAGVEELSMMQELCQSIQQVSRRCRDCV